MQYPNEISAELWSKLTQIQLDHFEQYQGDTQEVKQLRIERSRLEPIPSRNHLKELLDVTFFSSLTQEESEAVRFTILYVNPEVAIENSWPCIRFERAFSFCTEHIRKLSPAAPPETVDIAVFSADGELKIWGLLYNKSSYLGLTLSSLQTGTFIAKFNFTDLLSYSRGDVVFFDNNTIELRGLLAKVFADQRPFPEKYGTAATLLAMCKTALDLGSGATLLILPQEIESIGLDAPRYSADNRSREILTAAITSPQQDYLISSVARLLFIDGAVVYHEGQGIVGAGAIINAVAIEDFPIKIWAPDKISEQHIAEICTTLNKFNGGARHSSALKFCYSNPGALAVVVSQDGVMSIMARPVQSDSVIVIRPIRRGFMLY